MKLRTILAWWPTILILALLLLAYVVTGAVDRRIAAIDAGPGYVRTVEYDLSKCTPRGARVTPRVRIRVRVTGNGAVIATGCSREGDRSLIPTSKIVSR